MLSAVVGLIMLALPPPPEIVVRETKYYGTVTIDHRKHLARRVACKTCHGPGPVAKLTFTPKVAHDRCIGCHKEESRGPTSCKDCHVKPPEPVVQAVADAGGAKTQTPEDAAASASSPAALATTATSAGAPATATSPGGPATGPPPQGGVSPAVGERFTRIVQLGFTADASLGAALRLSTRQHGIAIDYCFERIGEGRDSRTLALVGVGIARSLDDRWNALASAVGGLDTAHEPVTGFMPAVGARVGVEWLPRLGVFHSVHLSVTGIVDVSNRRTMGQDIGGTHVYGTLATGLSLPGKSGQRR